MLRRAGGYAIVTDPDRSSPEEIDTFRCAHCGKITHCIDPHTKQMANPMDLGGLCYQCDSLICARCVGKGCTPLEKRIEEMETRGRWLREAGL